MHRDRRCDLAHARLDRAHEPAVARLQEAAAEEELHRLPSQIEACERDAREGDDLRGEPVDDLRGDGVVGSGSEDDGRQLREAPDRDRAPVDLLSEPARLLHVEMRRDEVLERRSRAATVLTPCRGRCGGEADVEPTAPVAGRRTECEKAGLAAVGGNTHAVDPGAADDRDAPAALGHARRTAKVSLATTTSSAQPRSTTAWRSSSSSAGKSTPAIKSSARSATRAAGDSPVAC